MGPIRPLILLSALALLSGHQVVAQNDIEHVIVETYYISSASDTMQTDGGVVAEGSKTYRIFLDLCDSCSLRGIYGTSAHPLSISSTGLIYNNLDRGKTFGHEINNSALDENTVALDSWLSLGAASNARFGILKVDDPDTTSEELFPNDLGMLANEDPLAGIPLTEADGLLLDTSQNETPEGFIVLGTVDPAGAFSDSTLVSAFVSDSTSITCSTPGVVGPTADNRILIAQLTTVGELSFCINVIIERPGGAVVRYVSGDTLLAEDETPNGLLCYPPVCGCTDPNFLEYDPSAGCDDGSCSTAIVFGCLDTTACNYDPTANFDLAALCCYGPDSCNGLDISIVCPGVGMNDQLLAEHRLEAFPNPVRDMLYLRVNTPQANAASCYILDQAGRCVREHRFTDIGNGDTVPIDLSELSGGIFLLRVLAGGEHMTRVIVKI
jgi:hypothetical protein